MRTRHGYGVNIVRKRLFLEHVWGVSSNPVHKGSYQDTKQFNLRAELVRRHSRLMRKVKPSHDEIVRLLGQRAEMSETAFVENTLDLAQNYPEMLLRVRYAANREHNNDKKRKTEAY